MKSFWKKKKVLVTGGTGFIGSHVVRELVFLESKVTVQVSVSTTDHKLKKNLSGVLSKVKIVYVNLEDEKKCKQIVAHQDIVLHFAGLDGGTAFKKEHTAEIFKVNSKITLNMLEAARVAGVKRFLLTSSTEVYPESAHQPIKESYGFMKGLSENIDGYVWSKRFSEIAAKMYVTQYGMNICIVRPSNLYGPGDHLDKGRVIPTFIEQALLNKPISVWNGGKQKKSFLFISDFVLASLAVVEYYKKFDQLNLAGERYLTIKELGKMIIRATKSKSKIKNIREQDRIFKDRVLSIQKAKNTIGFHENITLEDGLAQTVEYFKQEMAKK